MTKEAILESLLFVVGDEGLTKEEIQNILEVDDIQLIIDNLIKEYEKETKGIELIYLGNRLKLVTKKSMKPYIEKMINVSDDGNLSQASLETLAIIAYNQPVTRLMVDEIRGVSSTHIIRKLVYKNLISEVGRSESAGRPILYGTTQLFLDYFGLNDLKELPNIEVEKNDEIKDLYQSKYKDE